MVLLFQYSHARNFSLRIDVQGRFLEYDDGSPFYYLGDTAWELLHRCTREEVELYFKNRADKGFNVIQTVALAELDGLNTPNVYGDRPLSENNPLKPNESYWQHVDWVIECAESYGLFIALLPTWGDKVDLLWGIGPVIFNAENSFDYGVWIANRYRKSPNIIWVIGGDRDCDKGNEPIWEGFARGIKSVDKEHLMTFHPRGGTSSSLAFHDSEWLDFNMLQSGHSARYIDNYRSIKDDYNRKPIKPCIDGESNYEAHSINWKREYGWFNDDDIRRAFYWGIFAGGCGIVYGAHPIWQMWDENRKSIGDLNMTWREALNLAGSEQVIYVRELLYGEDFRTLRPSQSILCNMSDEGVGKILAMSDKDRILIYQTIGCQTEVNISQLQSEKVSLKWFNPRNGTYSDSQIIDSKEKIKITAPVIGIDWVAVIKKISNENI